MSEDRFQELEMIAFRFHMIGDWERLRETCAEMLSINPEDANAHHLSAKALHHLDRFEEGARHIKKAIELEPDDSSHYHAAGWLHLAWGRQGPADEYARKALQLEPDDADNWILMGYCSVSHNSPKHALSCAQKARELEPENTASEQLEAIARPHLEGKDAIPPAEQLANFQRLLANSPDDAFIYYNIGNLQLNEFDDAPAAEEHFRQALKLEPQDKDYQKALISALRRRSPILRLLWLPFWPTKKILNIFEWAWDKKWPFILLIPVAKYLMILAAFCFVIFAFFFWPVAKAYEYLTIAELHKKMGRLAYYTGPMARLHKSPFWLRMLLFMLLIAIVWGIAGTLFFSRETSGTTIAVISGIAVSLVTVAVIASWIYYFYDKTKRARRSRKNKKVDQIL